MSDTQTKLRISAFTALLFFLVSCPKTYQFVDGLLGGGIADAQGCPTWQGRLVHSLVFFLLNVVVMYLGKQFRGDGNHDWGLYVKYSLYGTLFFFVLSSPEVYKLVGGVVGGDKMLTNAETGCPNSTGLAIHSVAYFLTLFGVMYLPPDRD